MVGGEGRLVQRGTEMGGTSSGVGRGEEMLGRRDCGVEGGGVEGGVLRGGRTKVVWEGGEGASW